MEETKRNQGDDVMDTQKPNVQGEDMSLSSSDSDDSETVYLDSRFSFSIDAFLSGSVIILSDSDDSDYF